MHRSNLFSLVSTWIILLFLLINQNFTVTASNIGVPTNLQGNYKVFIPLVIKQLSLPVPEVDPSPCLWSYTSGSQFPVYYKWGSGLTVPGSLWRLAFEYGFTQWNYVDIKPVFIFDSNATTVVETYDDPFSGNRGITTYICMGPPDHLLPTDLKIRGNVALDLRDNYTTNQRRGIAAHEVGHGTMISHIPNSYSWPALMHQTMDLPDFESIYVPQSADIALVNQKYP